MSVRATIRWHFLLLLLGCGHDTDRENPFDPALTPKVEGLAAFVDSTGHVVLNWQEYQGSQPFSRYLLLRQQTPGTRVDTIARLDDRTTTTFVDSTAEQGGNFAYSNVVISGGGFRVESEKVAVGPVELRSVDIIDLHFDSPSASAQVTWTPFRGGSFTSYRLIRVTNGTTSTIYETTHRDSIVFVDSLLVGGVEYAYRVETVTTRGVVPSAVASGQMYGQIASWDLDFPRANGYSLSRMDDGVAIFARNYDGVVRDNELIGTHEPSISLHYATPEASPLELARRAIGAETREILFWHPDVGGQPALVGALPPGTTFAGDTVFVFVHQSQGTLLGEQERRQDVFGRAPSLGILSGELEDLIILPCEYPELSLRRVRVVTGDTLVQDVDFTRDEMPVGWSVEGDHRYNGDGLVISDGFLEADLNVPIPSLQIEIEGKAVGRVEAWGGGASYSVWSRCGMSMSFDVGPPFEGHGFNAQPLHDEFYQVTMTFDENGYRASAPGYAWSADWHSHPDLRGRQGYDVTAYGGVALFSVNDDILVLAEDTKSLIRSRGVGEADQTIAGIDAIDGDGPGAGTIAAAMPFAHTVEVIKVAESNGFLLRTSTVVIRNAVGSEPGSFVFPIDVALSGDGRLYVIDAGNSRIQVFDEEGNYITHFGQRGTGPGEFEFGTATTPSALSGDIAVGSDGNVYVVDQEGARLQVFAP